MRDEPLAPLEQALDKPVVSSNQTMRFQALGALAIDTTAITCGRLFA